ncbi:hypothetical protein [Paenibacillus sacheonensis]|uniref:hypothetical protein n=1 Tax=Paenibacillus sacheonensis TaxID=742054 RepID=UPI0014790E05|nr:hypothetical protein [Paenibacillus sacheonensis]
MAGAAASACLVNRAAAGGTAALFRIGACLAANCRFDALCLPAEADLLAADLGDIDDSLAYAFRLTARVEAFCAPARVRSLFFPERADGLPEAVGAAAAFIGARAGAGTRLTPADLAGKGDCA